MALDLERPCFPPSVMRKLALRLRGKDIGKGNLLYFVQGTIREPTTPPAGRGSSMTLSFKDQALMIKGLDVSTLGIPPHRVVVCVDAIRSKWDAIFPDGVSEEALETLGHRGSFPKRLPSQYLFAGITKGYEFRAYVMQEPQDLFRANLDRDWTGREVMVASELTRSMWEILVAIWLDADAHQVIREALK